MLFRSAVRIDDGQAVAGVKVGDHHVAHEGGLAHARLAENSHVLPARVFVDRDGAAVTLFCAEKDLHGEVNYTAGKGKRGVDSCTTIHRRDVQ